jgi:MFS family permease
VNDRAQSNWRPWTEIGYALRNRNVRRYLAGQGLSQTGLWVQQTAELWLILKLTGNPLALGLHSVFRFGPILLLSPFVGVIGDRFDRLSILKVTQSLHAVAVTSLAIYASSSQLSLLVIYLIVLIQGLVNTVDNPVRRGFVRDLATDDELPNAVALSTTANTITRALGPAIGGFLILSFGLRWCFTFNAVSYGAVLIALYTIDRSKLRERKLVRGPNLVRAGFRYAWRAVDVRRLLALVGVVAVFGWNWVVLMPVYASESWQGGVSLYGVFLSFVGFGSLVGALIGARSIQIEDRLLVRSTSLLAGALAIVAFAPNVAVALIGLFLLGLAGTLVIVSSQTRLLVQVDEDMTGRIMALYTVGFVGSKPMGGLLGGCFASAWGPRSAFAIGAAAIGIAGVVLARTLRSP